MNRTPLMAQLLFSFLYVNVIALVLSVSVVSASPSALQANEFKLAARGAQITFPRDHGAHSDFKTEWWYLTGQLALEGRDLFKDGADFGFQITFFRRASGSKVVDSDWSEQYLAHSAVTDIREGRFSFEKRYVRGGLGVASVGTGNLNAELGEWRLNLNNRKLSTSFSVTREANPKYQLQLASFDTPEPLLHGDDGYSQKGKCDSCASLYYSIPHIPISGIVNRDGKEIRVNGLAWLDHEWMSGAIDPEQVGWDWFSIMTPSGDSVMVFQLRDRSGAKNFGSGTISSDSGIRKLSQNEFSIIPTARWKSDNSNALYPSGWRILIPGYREFSLDPVLKDQELLGAGHTYWEGAIVERNDRSIGYAELTGYAAPIGGF